MPAIRASNFVALLVRGPIYREHPSEVGFFLVCICQGELYHEININLAFDRASRLVLDIEL